MARNAVHVVGTVPVSGTITTVGTITNPVPLLRPRGAHTVAAVTVAVADTEKVAADANRVYFAWVNNSAFDMIVNQGGAAATATLGVKVAAGQVWEPADCPTGAIHAMCPDGGGTEPATVITRSI